MPQWSGQSLPVMFFTFSAVILTGIYLSVLIIQPTIIYNVGGDCFAEDLSCLQIYVYIVHMYKFSCPCIVYLIAEQLRKWVCKIYFLFVLHFKNGWIYLKFILYSFWGGFFLGTNFIPELVLWRILWSKIILYCLTYICKSCSVYTVNC